MRFVEIIPNYKSNDLFTNSDLLLIYRNKFIKRQMYFI